MSRKTLALAVAVLVVLGLVFGWLLQQWLFGVSPVSPVSDSGVPVLRPASHAGYCCVQPGTACSEAENPGACFRSGGVFNTDQRNCDYYCVNSQP